MHALDLSLEQDATTNNLTLTPDQVKLFHDDGYLSLNALAAPKEVPVIKDGLNQLFEERVGFEEGAYVDLLGEMNSPQILNPVNYLPKLHKTQCFQNALAIAKQLLGKDARCFFDLTILKRAAVGPGTPWHQDEAFRDPRFEYNEITVWMPLQDVTLETSCLYFVPGSHKAPVLEHHTVEKDHGVLSCDDNFDRSAGVPCEIAAGGCTIHHHRTLHCAGPNVSNRPRLTYIMTFGTPPKPIKQERIFPWLAERETQARARKRHWMRRGGVFITVWRRLRRGDLFDWRFIVYGIKRSIQVLHRGG